MKDMIRKILKEGKEVRVKHEIKVPKSIEDIHKIFEGNGFKLYLVGGAIRDVLTNRYPKDFDLATDAVPEKIKELLPMYPTIESGEQFGVVNVVTDEGTYEIATFREDIGAGRRPDEVKFSTIEKDVLRRDLTINALFYDLDTKEIVDLVGGINDIENGIVRTVGDAKERFNEDKLRILRALRFAGRVGSDVDEGIDKAIREDNSTISGDGKPLAQERIQDEFVKGIKQSISPKHFVELVKKYGLFEWVFKNLPVEGPIVESRHPSVVIASLFRDTNLNMTNELKRLKFTMSNPILPRQVAFLIKFFQTASVDTAYELKPYHLSSRIDNSILSEFGELNSMDKIFVRNFGKYEITTEGSELTKQGFRGVELGKEKKRIETEKFRILMGKSLTAYSGIILDEDSHNKLLDLIHELFEADDWDEYAHHMTVNIGPLPMEYRSLIGQTFNLTVTDIGHTDMVIGVKVDTSFKTYGTPHVTVLVNKGGKPDLMRRVTNYKPLMEFGKTPFNISGTLQEIPR